MQYYFAWGLRRLLSKCNYYRMMIVQIHTNSVLKYGVVKLVNRYCLTMGAGGFL